VGKVTPKLLFSAEPDLDQYLGHFARLEDAARADGYPLARRITVFRKLYYDSKPPRFGHRSWHAAGLYLLDRPAMWDVLIPAAATTKPPPSWSLPTLEPSLRYIADHQELSIAGTQVDFGHVLAGADARAHPTSLRLGFGLLRLRSNHDTATFFGDLASVVVEYLTASRQPFALTARVRAPLLEVFYDSVEWGKSGAADMAGNADSYALRFEEHETLAAGLRAYFAMPGGGARRRFSSFARAIGLGALDGDRFSGDTPALRDAWRRETFNAALAFVAATGRRRSVARVLLRPFPGRRAPTLWEAYRNCSHWVVDIFIARMARHVAQEQEEAPAPV
jgi:hypothetical protein